MTISNGTEASSAPARAPTRASAPKPAAEVGCSGSETGPGQRPGLMAIALTGGRLVPKNLLSWATGALARSEPPRPVAKLLCRGFARVFGIDLDEAELGIDKFASIEALFTRRLRPGARPISPPLCAPADGTLVRSAPVTSGETAIQAKGMTYSLAELVFGEAPRPKGEAIRHQSEFVWYQTIYLAPHNYHRVHAPCTGRITAVRYIPGDLWPVNQPTVARLPRLFTRNERLVFDLEAATGGVIHVVMVGAFNVGRMTTPLVPELVTNALGRQLGGGSSEVAFETPAPVTAGEELGMFMLGSTVILVYDRDAIARPAFKLVQAESSRPILMGQSLLTQQGSR